MKEKKETKKETKKPEVKKSGILYKITKPNGSVIERCDLGDYVKVYESKGYKVEEL